jgi:plastocyanin
MPFHSVPVSRLDPASTPVPVGTTVTRTWRDTRGVSHSVQSLGSPGFPSSAILSGDGQRYQVTVGAPGVYHYDCAVHGSIMSGTITVQ